MPDGCKQLAKSCYLVPVGENSFLANPEGICYKIIFSLIHNIDKVV